MSQNGNDASAVATAPVEDLQTRFLYFFSLDRRRFKEAVDTLLVDSLGTQAKIWKARRPPGTYLEGLAETVAATLLPAGDGAESGYFQIPGSVAAPWFQDAALQLQRGRKLPVRLIEEPSIELFLTVQGTGILSLTLSPGHYPLDLPEALSFNLLISQGERGTSVDIHIPHPSEDQERWSQMLVGARNQFKPAPGRFAPLEERLGVPGGTFTVIELVARLLRPLEAFALLPAQKGLNVYTVARVGPQGSVNGSPTQNAFGNIAAAVARVGLDELDGAPPGGSEATEPPLAAGHFIAVSPNGASHVLVDYDSLSESRDVGDALKRTAQARDQLFVPFVIAYGQWSELERLRVEADRIALSPRNEQTERISHLRTRMIQFKSAGYFAHISSRLDLEQYYGAVQQGLGIANRCEEVRESIAELETAQAAARQDQAAVAMLANQKTLDNLRRMMIVVAACIISLYFSTLYYMVIASAGIAGRLLLSIGQVLVAVISLVGAGLLLGYRKR